MGPFTILQSALNGIVSNRNYLFRFLKTRRLSITVRSAGKERHSTRPIVASLLLSVVPAPLALLAYRALLAAGSGNVFTLYFGK